jgi:hypothetical protein
MIIKESKIINNSFGICVYSTGVLTSLYTLFMLLPIKHEGRPITLLGTFHQAV